MCNFVRNSKQLHISKQETLKQNEQGIQFKLTKSNEINPNEVE